RLFATRPGIPEARPFELPPADVLAISAAGEMVVRLEKDGTLARVPLLGGAPREVANGVFGADFSADGARLAIARHDATKVVLESPAGTTVHESANALTSPRVAPDGTSIAFLEEPARFAMQVEVRLLEGGRVRTLAADASPDTELGWSRH